ncbi:hypothetical protein, partial [Methylobacterium sp. A54F]
GDTAPEADETVLVRLSNPSGATVADGEANGTIANDDSGLSVGGIDVYAAAPSLQGQQGATPTAAPDATDTLRLVRLGAYLTTDDTATARRANAEVVAYDRTTGSLYVQNTVEN